MKGYNGGTNMQWAVAIPVLAACIAAGAATYGAWLTRNAQTAGRRLSRDMKIAEFRQAWINELRETMAEFQSFGVVPGADPSRIREFYKAGTKIELLMNPADEDYQRLQDCMYRFLEVSEKEKLEKYSSNPEYLEVCQRILKREWDRLKNDLASAEK